MKRKHFNGRRKYYSIKSDGKQFNLDNYVMSMQATCVDKNCRAHYNIVKLKIILSTYL